MLANDIHTQTNPQMFPTQLHYKSHKTPSLLVHSSFACIKWHINNVLADFFGRLVSHDHLSIPLQK